MSRVVSACWESCANVVEDDTWHALDGDRYLDSTKGKKKKFDSIKRAFSDVWAVFGTFTRLIDRLNFTSFR